jgi:type IV pilus assembly protein PilA
MPRTRAGFTLIELLIVIVIIGILAAIAIPKFGTVRERSYYRAMMSDLRNLNTQQELYYTRPQNNYNYASGLSHIPEFMLSAGVSITVTEATNQGWAATASHAALGSRYCGIFIGTVASPPSFVADPGIIACEGY